MKGSTAKAARRLLVAVPLMAALMLGAAASADAQDNYPSRDITFVIPYAPGGSSDPIGRQFASQLEKVLRANVVVENRPGGSTTIGVGRVVRAKPDGYTIGMTTNSGLVFQPMITSGLSWKTPDDYQLIVKLSEMPAILLTKGDAPWKTFDEFIAAVRKNPGRIRAGVSGLRGGMDLTVQYFNKINGVKIATVPFTGGSGDSLKELLGGRVEAVVTTGTSSLGHVQAGTLRALAVFQPEKYDAFAGAVPVIRSGNEGWVRSAYYVIAPKGLPAAVRDKLAVAALQVARSDEFLKFCKDTGYMADPKGIAESTKEVIQEGKIYAELLKFMDQK